MFEISFVPIQKYIENVDERFERSSFRAMLCAEKITRPRLNVE